MFQATKCGHKIRDEWPGEKHARTMWPETHWPRGIKRPRDWVKALELQPGHRHWRMCPKSRIRHRNALTAKAWEWEDAVQGTRQRGKRALSFLLLSYINSWSLVTSAQEECSMSDKVMSILCCTYQLIIFQYISFYHRFSGSKVKNEVSMPVLK